MKKKKHNHTKTYLYRPIRIHATFNKLQIHFTYTKECEGKTLSRIEEITSSFIWFLTTVRMDFTLYHLPDVTDRDCVSGVFWHLLPLNAIFNHI